MEKFPPNEPVEQEKTPERLPSKEELTSVFESIIRGKEYKEVRYKENEKGEVILFEIEITFADGKIEYTYEKAKTEGGPSASIHDVIYDETGYPTGGRCMSNYINGVWEHVNQQGDI